MSSLPRSFRSSGVALSAAACSAAGCCGPLAGSRCGSPLPVPDRFQTSQYDRSRRARTSASPVRLPAGQRSCCSPTAAGCRLPRRESRGRLAARLCPLVFLGRRAERPVHHRRPRVRPQFITGRFERLYLDRSGSLRPPSASRGSRRCCWSTGTGRFAKRAHRTAARPIRGGRRKLQSLAAGSRRRMSGFDDFRLPRVGGRAWFLSSTSQGVRAPWSRSSRAGVSPAPVARSPRFRPGSPGRRRFFVAVFIDAAPESRIRGFLAAAGVTPDFVLRDSEFRLAGYGIHLRALIVIDPGEPVLSRSGYRDEDRDTLYRAESAFDGGGPPVGSSIRSSPKPAACTRRPASSCGKGSPSTPCSSRRELPSCSPTILRSTCASQKPRWRPARGTSRCGVSPSISRRNPRRTTARRSAQTIAGLLAPRP